MVYYIYVYLDQRNIPFYIGKGKNDRYKVPYHIGNINRILQNKIQKVGINNIKIAFLHRNLSEDQAFLYEKVWIKLIGRKDLKLGPLCNRTNGGDGVKGMFFTQEQRNKMSIMRKGKPGTWKGKHHSEHTKQLLSSIKKNTSEEIRLKISNTLKGRPLSEETKRKMSIAKKGKLKSLQTRERMKKAQYGKIITKETRDKMKATREKNKNNRILIDGKTKYSSAQEGAESSV